jgi:glyoxylase-like metal-dependent hydrolase (beta-lactamase superfamily II)/rhodanese-related sulfurtransferase
VDPALDVSQYLQLAQRREFKIELAIDTHIHADHVSGARVLAEKTGAEVAMHESADVMFPIRRLADGEALPLGQLRLEIWHTPGHRPEGISILVTNPPRGDSVSSVLTGDSLFVGDVGRPDFGGAEGASKQYDSVHRLLRLEDFVEVFPAHFEGSCGKGMCGRPSSTIGFERRFNPLLHLSKPRFIEAMSQAPARPLNMTAILATNRGESDFAFAEPKVVDSVRIVGVEEAASWLSHEKPTVIDVREPAEFDDAHLPGAVSIPQSALATHLHELKPDGEYLVVCAGGVRSLRAVHYLASRGYSNVVSLAGGTAGWIAAGNPTEGAGRGPAMAADGDSYFHGAH